MITVKLYGRLGNQAFQISACIGTAMKYGVKYIIPKKTITPSVWPAYFSDLFQDRERELQGQKLQVFTEPSHAYAPIPKWHPKIVYDGLLLNGFFQSERYFRKYIPQIRGIFCIPSQTSWGRVAIHYRAGDFRRFLDKHPIVSADYLYASICYFEMLGYKDFFVFSDEPDSVKDILKGFHGLNIEYSEGNAPMEDFKLMSSCEHGVVSNSSFSVMAQILNPNPNKIIIRPDFFFGPGNAHLDTKDVYPENWITL